MKQTTAAIVAILLMLGLSASANPAPEDPKIIPQIAVVVYPKGKFFTPEGVPELKGYLCLAGIGLSGQPEIHCAPAPRLI